MTYLNKTEWTPVVRVPSARVGTLVLVLGGAVAGTVIGATVAGSAGAAAGALIGGLVGALAAGEVESATVVVKPGSGLVVALRMVER